uniref:Transmembrane protein n=1 Tax=Meloidogyne incognita TaxID=6306 RepID=A0A914KT93_MELIC
MPSSKTVSMLFATFVFVIYSVGLLNLVESTTTRIIEVGRGKHKLEGDNVILSDGSRIAEREDMKDYNFLSPKESCVLHIEYNNNIIVYFQEDGDCIVDLIVEDSDILNFFDISHTVEFTIVLHNYNDSLSKCLGNCSDFELMNTNILTLAFNDNDFPLGVYHIGSCFRKDEGVYSLVVGSFQAASCAYSSMCLKHKIDISQEFIKLNFLMNSFPHLIEEEKFIYCYPPSETNQSSEELITVKAWKIINVGDNSDESLIGKRLIVLHLLPNYIFPSCTENGTVNEEEKMDFPRCYFAIEFSGKKYKLLTTKNPWKTFTKTPTSIKYSTTKTLQTFNNKTFTTTLNPENNSTITETISTKTLNISENITLLTTTKTLNKTKATIPVLIFPPEPNKREKDGVIDAIIMFAILILILCFAIGYYLIYLKKKEKPGEDEFKSDLSINPVVIVAEDEGLDVDKTQEDEETSSDNENSEEVEIVSEGTSNSLMVDKTQREEEEEEKNEEEKQEKKKLKEDKDFVLKNIVVKV